MLTGDRIIWINRTDVQRMSLQEVLDVLDKAPDGSSLVISRKKDHELLEEGRTILSCENLKSVTSPLRT